MSLRAKTKAASAERAKTRSKRVTALGNEYEVRGMTAGEKLRVGMVQNEHGAERAMPTLIAICTYDPASGEQVWNPNSGPDLLEIAALDSDVFDPLQEAALEVSGMAPPAEGAEGNAPSDPTNGGSSSSPGSSEDAPSPSGETP